MGEDFLIEKAILAYSFLGLSFGVLFDFATALQKAVKAKGFSFFLDLILTVLASVALGCVMIAYSNGGFKGLLFLVLAACLVLYLLTLHKIIYPLFYAIFYPFQKSAAFFLKKLKNGKKSLKKVLHSHK